MTQKDLKKILKYSRATGVFTWKVSRGGLLKGDIAGHRNSEGYVRIRINGKQYYAHNLAWLYVTSNWPTYELDHRDRVRWNNAFRNLRDLPHHDNSLNRGLFSNSRSGIKGVAKLASGKYRASITVQQKVIYCGTFGRKRDAHKARRDAERLFLQSGDGRSIDPSSVDHRSYQVGQE